MSPLETKLARVAGERFTVLGATGFVGGHLCARLQALGAQVVAPGRDAWESVFDAPLGRVIFAVGLTADFRTRALDTADAHVGRLVEVLRRGAWTSLVYLSSTRLYGRAADGDERTPIPVDAADGSDLYTATKLAGEALVCATGRPEARVARLSNLYGAAAIGGRGMAPETFLASILAGIAQGNPVMIGTHPASTKDYACVADACDALIGLAMTPGVPIVNVASGAAVAHATLAMMLTAATGVPVKFQPRAPRQDFPDIATTRLVAEQGGRPKGLAAGLPGLLRALSLAGRTPE